MKEKKIYDFPFEKVKDQVIGALKRGGNRGTVADMVTTTGLPAFQVEKVLPVISSECRGLLQVTQSGEILYYFPQGMANQETGSGAFFRKILKQTLKVTAMVLKFLFKAWMMVMLVAYFLIFATLLILAIVGAAAASAAKKDDNRSSSKNSFFGFHLVLRLIELAINLWIYSGSANKKEGKKRPFYKSVFAFVFGTGATEEDWKLLEKKAFIKFVQNNKGCITEPELMALLGRSNAESTLFLNRALLEYEGEPKVTQDGTLYYFFPNLLKTTTSASDFRWDLRPQVPFSGNEKSTTRWIFGLNLFNTVFSLYFLFFGLFPQPENDLAFLFYFTAEMAYMAGSVSPEFLTTLALGIIPGVYSLFFFGIPFIRNFQLKTQNRKIRESNFKRKIFKLILDTPEKINLDMIQPSHENETPFRGQGLEKWKEGAFRDLAQDRNMDVGVTGPQTFEYCINDLKREKQDMILTRQKIDPQQFALGAKVFDSGEKFV